MADIDELRGVPQGTTVRRNTVSQDLPDQAQQSVDEVSSEHKIENDQPARAPEVNADALNYEAKAQRVAGEVLGNMIPDGKDVYITENLLNDTADEYKSSKKMSREFKKEQKEAWKDASQEVEISRKTLEDIREDIEEEKGLLRGTFSVYGKGITLTKVYDENGKPVEKLVAALDKDKHLQVIDGEKIDLNDEMISKSVEINFSEEAVNSTLAHEKSHATVDKMNTYAPGLTWEQYAKLNAYDEIRSNIVQVNNAMKKYAQDGDLKHLTNSDFNAEDLKALTDAVHDGKVKVGDENYQKLLAESVSSYWTKNKMEYYEEQLRGISEETATHVSSLILPGEGNAQSQKEFNKRLEKVFQNVDGMNLGKYMPDIELSANLKQTIERDRQYSLARRGISQEGQSVLAQTKKPETIFQKAANWAKKLGKKMTKDGDVASQEVVKEKASKARDKIAKKIIKLSGRSSNETPAPVTKTEASANLLAANIQRDGGR